MLRSIRSKVLAAVLVVALATSASVTMVFYLKSASMIEENYARNSYSRLKQNMDMFEEGLREIYHVNVKASCSQKLIGEIVEFESTGDETCLGGIAELLKGFCEQYSGISSVYLVLPSEQITVTSDEYPVYRKNIEEEILEGIAAGEEESMGPVIIDDYIHHSANLLSFMEPVENEEGKTIAYLLANVEEGRIYYDYLDGLRSEGVQEAVILAEDSRIVARREFGDMGNAYERKEKVMKEEGSRTENGEIQICVKGVFTDFAIFMRIQKSAVLKDLRKLQGFFLVILAAFSGLAVLAAYMIARAMYRPMHDLTAVMEEVGGGNLEVRADITTRDEIATMAAEFNRMLDHINELIGRLIEEERLKKDAELEALQYQITPHFMYNTLNSIKYAALMKGDKEIGRLIGDFVELLQACINKKGAFLSVAEEIHILENYLNLQRFRYEGNFEVNYEIEPEAQGCYIPRLLLQPLVENSLLHGIDVKNKTGKLDIAAFVKEERLVLKVSDNGRGMTEEQIDKLLHAKTEKKSGLSAVGVSNIRERLALYYGNQGGISYSSDENGTTATIFIPVEKG